MVLVLKLTRGPTSPVSPFSPAGPGSPCGRRANLANGKAKLTKSALQLNICLGFHLQSDGSWSSWESSGSFVPFSSKRALLTPRAELSVSTLHHRRRKTGSEEPPADCLTDPSGEVSTHSSTRLTDRTHGSRWTRRTLTTNQQNQNLNKEQNKSKLLTVGSLTCSPLAPLAPFCPCSPTSP